ncbi:MAG: KEOPS complex subunit Pcc1 [Nitrososphaerota archaeon]
MPRLDLKLRVEASRSEFAKALYRALAPDNVHIPEGLQIFMRLDGRFLRIHIKASNRLDTFIATLDEVLEHIQLSLYTLQKLV